MIQRVLFLSAVAAAGLVGLMFGELGPVAAILPVLGFVSAPGQTVLALACVAAVYLGALDLSSEGTRARMVGAAPPALLMVGFALCRPVLPDGVSPWLPLAILSLILPVMLFTGSGEKNLPSWLYPALSSLPVYVTALIYFAGVYATRWRALFAAPAVGAGAALLALALWQAQSSTYRDAQTSETAAAAFVVGLVLAQATWALLFWPAPALTAGLAMLALFYGASGVIVPARQGDAHAVVAAEYALVGLAALAVVVWVVLRVP